MRDLEEVRRQYDDALVAFVDTLEQDRTIVAAVLFGSLAYDVVWERSDIDMMIVRDDRKARRGSAMVALTSHGVNIHAIVTTRADFRRSLQSSIGGGFMHSTTSLGRMLFCRDESLERIFLEVQALGEHDRRVRLLQASSFATYMLDKAEKWVRVKQDAHYASLWVGNALPRLADIEVLMHKQVPSRESLLQAVDLNPDFFGPLYRDFTDAPKTVPAVEQALDTIYAYLDERLDDVFGPLLEYLDEERTVRSVTEIEQHFERQMDVRMIASACEWLAARGVIVKASAPFFLNEHSRVELEQLAFFSERDR